MSNPRAPASSDQILDLLLDALAERQARRGAQAKADEVVFGDTTGRGVQSKRDNVGIDEAVGRGVQLNAPTINDLTAATKATIPLPPSTPALPLQLGRTLNRLCLLLGVLVVLINVPLSAGGLNLAHLVPSTASLIIRDGLVLKGPGPEIYVLQDNKLRWISSLDAFQYFGYRWDQVHVVDAAFLDQFSKGAPLSVLLKCDTSPHIYVLENDRKRWIKDIPTFAAQGFVWSDVKPVDCAYLRGLPNGAPIPTDAGAPPEP